MELGRHLVEELGHEDRGTTLGRWMAHHLAGLMREAEDASTAARRMAARKAAEKLIRELWAQRTSLPGSADPMARYERAIALLEQLSPIDLPWHRHSGNRLHSAAAELNAAAGKLIYSLILSEVSTELPRAKFEEMALEFLEHTEQRLYHQLGSVLIKLVDPTEAQVVSPELSIEQRVAASQKSLVDKATQALTTIRDLLNKPALSAIDTDAED